MSSTTKQSVVRYTHMVPEHEFIARRYMKLVPDRYTLTRYQMSLIEGYTDSSYTRVRLLDGTTMRTLDFKQSTPKHKPIKRQANNDFINSSCNRNTADIQRLCNLRPDYSGTLNNSIYFIRRTGYTGGGITLRNPNNQEEYLVDCYLACDSVESWDYAVMTLTNLYKLAFAASCKDIDIDYVMKVLYPKFKKGTLREKDFDFLLEEEVVEVPDYVEGFLLKIQKHKFMKDGGTNIAMDLDMLIAIGELQHNTSNLKESVKKKIYQLIKRRLYGKPTLKDIVKHFLYVNPTRMEYPSIAGMLSKYLDNPSSYLDVAIQAILSYGLYQHKLDLENGKIIPPTTVRAKDIEKLRPEGVELQILAVIKVCKYKVI